MFSYAPMQQDLITKETLELIAQQTATTQLVILLVLTIAVGGTIAFFTLRGGLKVFEKLSISIDNSNKVETERHETQKRLVSAIEGLEGRNQERFNSTKELVDNTKNLVDDTRRLVINISNNISDLDQRILEIKDAIANNPTDEKLYRLLVRINTNLEKTKEQTDEIEATND